MSTFFRLLNAENKEIALAEATRCARNGIKDDCAFDLDPGVFDAVPGKPFSYWVSESFRESFRRLPPFESEGRSAFLGGSTKNDFRFLRLFWESEGKKWIGFAKGGEFSRFYSPIYLLVNWDMDARELEAELLKKYPYLGDSAEFVLHRNNPYFQPGLTWTRRTSRDVSVRVLPKGCVFSDKGPSAFIEDNDEDALLSLLAIMNSRAFSVLLSIQLAAADAAARSYEVGLVQQTPVPQLRPKDREALSLMARSAWSLKRDIDSIVETSHAFLLPPALRGRLGQFDLESIESELIKIGTDIDHLTSELYEFSDEDCARFLASNPDETSSSDQISEPDDSLEAVDVDSDDTTLSWAVGVVFGRFDWRLATGERGAPPISQPFDPLPAKSPGMLPEDSEPFHHNVGILADDEGQKDDLPRLIEHVLRTVDAQVSLDVRLWLRKEFFPFHLKRYSKSRRKAPIYWPISTTSGSYTVWLYYPELTSQTLFTTVNDFVEPKLNSVHDDLSGLRSKGGGRSKQEERDLENLADLERELADLRETLLEIAPDYRPNLDDGVQITAAPLWPLFREKSWQKVLKDTWGLLEEGEYDWANLALNYWPERVLGKSTEDRSIAIAHDVVELFWEQVDVPVIRRGKDTGETRLDWKPRELSEAEIQTLIKIVIEERGLQSEFR